MNVGFLRLTLFVLSTTISGTVNTIKLKNLLFDETNNFHSVSVKNNIGLLTHTSWDWMTYKCMYTEREVLINHARFIFQKYQFKKIINSKCYWIKLVLVMKSIKSIAEGTDKFANIKIGLIIKFKVFYFSKYEVQNIIAFFFLFFFELQYEIFYEFIES